jgi:hypothetical protein
MAKGPAASYALVTIETLTGTPIRSTGTSTPELADEFKLHAVISLRQSVQAVVDVDAAILLIVCSCIDVATVSAQDFLRCAAGSRV